MNILSTNLVLQWILICTPYQNEIVSFTSVISDLLMVEKVVSNSVSVYVLK